MHSDRSMLSAAFIGNIVKRMSELDITQTELARRMKVSSPYVTKLLNRDINLSFGTASKLANALGLDFQPVLSLSGSISTRSESFRHAEERAET